MAHRLNKRFLRPHEQDQVTQDKAVLRKVIESPNIENKAAAHAAYRRLEKMEEEQSVPDVSALDRDKIARKRDELEEKIKEGMLSHEEMRRNPPGAVDQNVRWQRQNKQRIQDWRNCQAILHKGIPADEAGSLFSVERLRPQVSRLNMAGAQIPAVRSFSFPSEAYKEGYEGINWGKPEEPSIVDELVGDEEPEPIEPEPEPDADDAGAVLQALSRNRREE